jgi:hypothetical protein
VFSGVVTYAGSRNTLNKKKGWRKRKSSCHGSDDNQLNPWHQSNRN